MRKLITHISGIAKLTSEAYDLLLKISDIKYVSLRIAEDLKNSLNACDIFWFRLNHKLTRDILENVKCKYIICAVTGLDHIDVEACKEFGIKVVSLKNEEAFLNEVRATAEHAIGLLLALIRKSKKAFTHVESGEWNRYLFQGTELYKKKIGILGLGRLGKIVAEYAIVFGMEVYFFDTKEQNVPHSYIRCDSKEDLCASVDILSIHLPYTEETHFMIDRHLLSQMKPTIFIVNTARGGLVDESELVRFLENNKISGYATDVIYGEPEIENHPLINYALKNENVIITPHIGGNTIESIEKTENFVANKLFNILKSI